MKTLPFVLLFFFIYSGSSHAGSLGLEEVKSTKVGLNKYSLNFANDDLAEALKYESFESGSLPRSLRGEAIKVALEAMFGKLERLDMDKTSGFLSSSVDYAVDLVTLVDGKKRALNCTASFAAGALAIGDCRASGVQIVFRNINIDNKHFGEGKELAQFIGFSESKLELWLDGRLDLSAAEADKKGRVVSSSKATKVASTVPTPSEKEQKPSAASGQ
jgi:hypothetical protein